MREQFKNKIMLSNSSAVKAAAFWSAAFVAVSLFCHYLTIELSGSNRVEISAVKILISVGIIIVSEFFRNIIIGITRDKIHKVILTLPITLVLSFTDLSFLFSTKSIDTPIEICDFIFCFVMPAIVNSFVLTELSFNGGIIPALIYRLVSLIPLLIPIEPNPYRPTALLFGILLPIVFLIILDSDFGKEQEKQQRKPRKIMQPVLAVVLIIVFIFFMGLFPVKPTAIATGSMEPQYQVGDMVIISKGAEYTVGDVIEFKNGSEQVVHRIAKITDDGNYITKGDANNADDAGQITKDDIVGKVIYKVPCLGWITLWIHSVH